MDLVAFEQRKSNVLQKADLPQTPQALLGFAYAKTWETGVCICVFLIVLKKADLHTLVIFCIFCCFFYVFLVCAESIHAAPRQGPPAPRPQGVISASVVVAPGQIFYVKFVQKPCI